MLDSQTTQLYYITKYIYSGWWLPPSTVYIYFI